MQSQTMAIIKSRFVVPSITGIRLIYSPQVSLLPYSWLPHTGDIIVQKITRYGYHNKKCYKVFQGVIKCIRLKGNRGCEAS